MRRVGRQILAAQFLALLFVNTGTAQSGSVEQDSLLSYELAEIVVGGAAQRATETGAVRRVPLNAIVRQDAGDVAGVLRLVPSAHLQTNSRGETLVYLRGAGERQVAVFLDGALLNTPWDNRVDVGLLPSSVLGGITVSQGGSSVTYGTNVLGGAINLTTRSLERTGRLTEMTALAGGGGLTRFDAMHLARRGNLSILASAGYQALDGAPLPGGVDLPYSQDASSRRTNSDRRIGHLFVRASSGDENRRFGVSVLHVDSEKGVAPESHLDPAVESIRFWRYPTWRMTQVTGQGLFRVGLQTDLHASLWLTSFAQRIDQYPDADYRTVNEQQDDSDGTVGVRLVANRPLARGTIRAALNGLLSNHRQTDSDLGGDAVLVSGPEQSFSQATWSAGVEYERILGDLRWVLGGNVDGFHTPKTGDKPGRDPDLAWGATASTAYTINPAWTARATVGRKVRFPTMRELFGTALNRFLVNDQLRSESAWLVDVGILGSNSRGAVELTAFLNRTSDTIDQENVMVDDRRLRRRINLDGSRVLGVELIGRFRIADQLEWEGSATVSDPVVLGEDGRDTLIEKPDALVTTDLTWTTTWGAAVTLQGVYTGRAYGLGTDNELVDLPRVMQWNARAALRRYTSSGIFAEFFLRADNMTDRALFPQLGLPDAGRQLRVGLSVAF